MAQEFQIPDGLPDGEFGFAAYVLLPAAQEAPVETGYTLVPLPWDDIIDGNHVLALFDEDEPELMVACGPVGGVLDSDGALTIGLLPVEDSAFIGVAYLSELEDGAATGFSGFVVEQETTAG